MNLSWRLHKILARINKVARRGRMRAKVYGTVGWSLQNYYLYQQLLSLPSLIRITSKSLFTAPTKMSFSSFPTASHNSASSAFSFFSMGQSPKDACATYTKLFSAYQSTTAHYSATKSSVGSPSTTPLKNKTKGLFSLRRL